MNEKDIDAYLRAKNPWNIGNIATHVALVSAGLAMLALFFPPFAEFAKYLLLVAFIAATSNYGVGHRSYVTRKELLAIIERNIHADPQLISAVSSRRALSRKGKKAVV